jgi:heterodisulfide reductase subunit A-like polyferredoxin
VLTVYAEKLPNVIGAQQVSYMCLPEGQARLRHVVQAHGANRVVVAACSHRTHESLFQRVVREAGLNANLVEMTNIREHCAWAHRHDPAGATRKAEELVRMSVARATQLAPVYKQGIVPTPRALVIGGGVSGMTAALAIADTGSHVTLIERAEQLGGNLNNLYFTAEGGNPQRLMRDLINRIVGHDRIQVYTRSQVVEHRGSVGAFQSIIATEVKGLPTPTRATVEHGVTIVATGGQEHRGDEYHLGKDPRVVTQHQLEEMIVNTPEKIAGLKQVAIIQCVREPEHQEYCSRVCCTNTMKNATRIKMLNPDCQVTVFFKNIITYGFREQYYTEARRRGVLFVRYTDETAPVVTLKDNRGEMKEWGELPAGDTTFTSIQIRAQEPMLNQEIVLNPDLLIVSAQVTPSEGTARLAETLRVPLSSEGFFMEAHLKMRPMDFMEEGIFIAGMAHYPKFIEESIAHALAAAGRAITILAQQPLFIGGVVAQVDQSKCVACLTCTRTCPFGIPRIDSAAIGNGSIVGAAWIDPAKCQGCGTCTSECPATAIQLVNYRDEQIMLRESAGLGAWIPQLTPA